MNLEETIRTFILGKSDPEKLRLKQKQEEIMANSNVIREAEKIELRVKSGYRGAIRATYVREQKSEPTNIPKWQDYTVAGNDTVTGGGDNVAGFTTSNYWTDNRSYTFPSQSQGREDVEELQRRIMELEARLAGTEMGAKVEEPQEQKSLPDGRRKMTL